MIQSLNVQLLICNTIIYNLCNIFKKWIYKDVIQLLRCYFSNILLKNRDIFCRMENRLLFSWANWIRTAAMAAPLQSRADTYNAQTFARKGRAIHMILSAQPTESENQGAQHKCIEGSEIWREGCSAWLVLWD